MSLSAEQASKTREQLSAMRSEIEALLAELRSRAALTRARRFGECRRAKRRPAEQRLTLERKK